jgi:PPK2 family polyphosphate:nucleotide phosphotransferase
MKAKGKLSPDALIRLADGCTVTDGRKFRIDKVKTDATRGLSPSKDEAEALLRTVVETIAAQQETLYAQNEWGVLLIFQAMDAAGKDSAIKHVFSGVNPQGVQVHSFKAPSPEELYHDFLWRTAVRLPERGRIGVFNRSYYEEVLVVRVHPDLLRSQRLPAPVVTKRIWAERLDDINTFERHLVRSGYLIRKFFLHVSREEQARRFLKRLQEPEKRWKFSLGDIRDREGWDLYMKAYETTIRNTTTVDAPWVVIPADRKWFARLVIAGAILGALKGLELHSPSVDPSHEQELNAVRETLLAEVGAPRKAGAKRR